MGCRCTQSLVVLLSLFNFVSLVVSGLLLFLTIAVSIGIRNGEFFVHYIYTYNAHVINNFMDETHILGRGINVLVGVYVCMAVTILAICTAIYGFVILCCRCKGTQDAIKTYHSLVIINATLHIAILVVSLAIMKEMPSSIRPAMRTLQNGIGVDVIDDLGGMELNKKGRLFLQIQDRYFCCGVNNASEWKEVEWFKERYHNAITSHQEKLGFPCTKFSEIAPILFPCNAEPSPDCTSVAPMTEHGCYEPLQKNIQDSIRSFAYVFSVICGVQAFGLIISSIYSSRVAPPGLLSTFDHDVVRNSSARVSVTSTQRLTPYYPADSSTLSTTDTDEIAQMCIEIIAKNNLKYT